MIFVTQLIYIKEGQESVFHQFEDLAIPIISKYSGRLLLRVRPTQDTIIGHQVETPYEIHLIEFEGEQDFENFKADDDRETLLYLKDRSVQSVMLIKGTKL